METAQTSVDINSINWEADTWFTEYYSDKITDDFKVWWLGYYGVPDDYLSIQQDEYWTRCGFAWIGWDAALNFKDIV